MAAMIGEIENDLDVIQFLNQSEDESSMDEMIRSTSGLFATLDKLTSEIVEDDLTSVEGGTSARSRSSAGSNSHESPTRNENDDDNNDDDDDDYYSDDDDGAYSDDEDPDSGETKLFSMMDELVAELQIQLEEDSDDDDNDNDDNNNDDNDKDKEDDETNASIVDGGKDNNGEGAVSNVNENTEHTSMAEAFTASATATVEDDDDDENNTEDDHRAEKQRHAELHQHVQTLLEQVVEMKMLFILDKTTTTTSSSSSSSARNKNDEKIGANIQKKILEDGDYYADRLEHLMGAISDYANKDAAVSQTTTALKPRHYVKIKKKKRKQRTNKHKKRKPRASVQTTRSLNILHDSLLALEEKLAREEQSWY